VHVKVNLGVGYRHLAVVGGLRRMSWTSSKRCAARSCPMSNAMVIP